MELEVIACSLEDARGAAKGGATRLEVTIALDRAGLTPPLELARRIAHDVPVRSRLMLRDRDSFELSGEAELQSLQEAARDFDSLSIDGLVLGYVKDGELDLETLEKIVAVAPEKRVTIHHAVEETIDPIHTLRVLGTHPRVDRVLVHGGTGSMAQRVERLKRYREAFGADRRLIVGGGVTLDMLAGLYQQTGIEEFHLGRAVRTPEETWGAVDPLKVRRAVELLATSCR